MLLHIHSCRRVLSVWPFMRRREHEKAGKDSSRHHYHFCKSSCISWYISMMNLSLEYSYMLSPVRLSSVFPSSQRKGLRIPYTRGVNIHWIFIEWVENDLLRGRRIRVLILYLCDFFLIRTCLTQFDLLPYFSNSQTWLWITFDFYLQMTEKC